ncbi:hypothetical protein F0365_03765 [Nonlabens sp. Ci31]|jgi:hypothetical protein|uniref:hypothetical protein n=1 Tax=Nonlabens sp. Ci31 TaxID=2608253 RepID=UPI001462F809|nr:hypothetical protein [Nonlabens sp. Ci31]QJP33588.1 hypothetical protein F0365_03765 [Nonlabens sp. Ci31]
MKYLFKLPVYFFLSVLLFSCDNDDGMADNQNLCTYQGLTFFDGTTQTLLAEAQLQTELFPNNNGPGVAAVEVYETTNPGNIYLTTGAVTLNAIGPGNLGINGTNYPVTVTCQRAGTAVGDEFRFDIVTVSGGFEGELCVVIDAVVP